MPQLRFEEPKHILNVTELTTCRHGKCVKVKINFFHEDVSQYNSFVMKIIVDTTALRAQMIISQSVMK